MTIAGEAPVALYVHFPFCISICPYCDFVVYGGRAARGPANQIETFLDALTAEIRLRASLHATRRPLDSVYLGGGTPSLMTARQVDRVLTTVAATFGIAIGAEITLEANPGPDDRTDLARLRAIGVNRLSIGAQSFSAGDLRRLGRRHSADDIVATVGAARSARFENISLDLLYDVPEQTPDSWLASVTAAVDLRVPHVSAYSLSVDDPDAEALTGAMGDHLPLRAGARRWRKAARLQQDEDRAARMYEMADGVLTRAGLEWYELSNWAVPGQESRHNLAYWHRRPWEAVGPGAHAFDGARTRRWNAARLDGYLAALLAIDGAAARLPPGGIDTTDAATARAEGAMLRLRTRTGLTFDLAAEFADQMRWSRANGLTERDPGGTERLTMRGRLLANELFARLMPDERSAAA